MFCGKEAVTGWPKLKSRAVHPEDARSPSTSGCGRRRRCADIFSASAWRNSPLLRRHISTRLLCHATVALREGKTLGLPCSSSLELPDVGVRERRAHHLFPDLGWQSLLLRLAWHLALAQVHTHMGRFDTWCSVEQRVAHDITVAFLKLVMPGGNDT